MLRRPEFLGPFGFALFALLFALGPGNARFAAASRVASGEEATAGAAAGQVVARSDDGAFVLRLLAPRSPYLFGRQRIEVEADVPAGDAVKSIDFFVDGHLRLTATAPPYRCDADFGEEIERHTILVLGATRQGRFARLSHVSRSARLGTHVEVGLVTIPVTVTDARGRFVENLGLSDFTLLEDDAPQQIVHFDREPTPVSLVIALDASESMKGTLWSAQKAANDFIATLPSFYKVSVVGFSDAVTLAQDFTFDRRGLAHAVNRLKPSGRTALFDTIRAAAAQLRDRNDRRVAVVFTDGGETVFGDDEAGRLRLDESIRMAREAGVTFFTIGFGPEAATALLRRIAEETGGESFDSSDPGALRAIYLRIAETLDSQYTLSYYPTRPIREGGWRSVTIRVDSPEVRVRSRPGYLAAH
jgi:VWFA-related protein